MDFFCKPLAQSARRRKRKTVMPPVAAEMVVFMATWAAKAPVSPLCIARVEPGLKPYQPNHRAKVPSLGVQDIANM